MPVPDKLLHLIEVFDRNAEGYRRGSINETETRVQFIDPLFELLGWDVHNARGYSEAFKDVVHEDAVGMEGAMGAPDYSFRVGGSRVFFLEAKKPSINIEQDINPALDRCLMIGAWHGIVNLLWFAQLVGPPVRGGREFMDGTAGDAVIH